MVASIFSATAQQTISADDPNYANLKANGQLENYTVVPSNNSTAVTIHPNHIAPQSRAGDCQCYQDPDGTYTLAMAPNDDGSSANIAIPFNFCFYGDTMTSMYINNNGNITFDNALAAFSAGGFPAGTDTVMIAPFWGDVDTSPAGGGEVWYKVTPTAIYVNWVAVGYYSSQTDKLNTFQLIITDGSDPVLTPGNNVAFCYKDMQWTTGSASNGVNGFGGVPATVGVNKGNGVDYIQMGRFDQPGVAYDGSFGNTDGISWLDNQSLYFNVCDANNIPPIASGIASCDTFRVCALNDTLVLNPFFLSPEIGQTTTVNFNANGASDITLLGTNSGNTASASVQIIGTTNNIGYNTITFTATDDGTPIQTTTVDVVIWVDTTGNSALTPTITGNVPSCGSVTLTANTGYDSYNWSSGDVTNTATYDSTQTFWLTVSQNNCYKSYVDLVEVYAAPVASLFDTTFCAESFNPFVLNPGNNVPDSAYTFVWNTNETTPTITVDTAGTYTVSVSIAGCPTATATANIGVTTVTIPEDTAVCGYNYGIPFNGVVSPAGGTWTWSGATTNDTLTFTPDQNTDIVTIDANNFGIYNLTYTDAQCGITKDMVVVFKKWAWTIIHDDTICNGTELTLTANQNIPQAYLWNDGSTDTELTVTETGTYYVTVSNTCNSYTDSAYIFVEDCDIFPPNVITINGDGINDTFVIEGVEAWEDAHLQIFSRLGRLIYNDEHYKNDWDGTNQNNGNKVSDGVYFYTVTLPNGVTKNGTISVIN